MTAVMIMSMQMGMSTTSFAAPGSADLSVVNMWSGYLGRAQVIDVCNAGDETVFAFNVSMTAPNFIADKSFAIQPQNQAIVPSNKGSINFATGDWTGALASQQCVSIAFVGEPNGPEGEAIAPSYEVTQGTLLNGVPNIDPNLNNNTVTGTTTNIVANVPDLKIEQRVLTEGAINVGDAVEYEMTVSNIGAGAQPTTSTIALVFVVPPEVNFVDVEELTGPNGEANPLSLQGCIDGGPTSNVGPGLANYEGSLRICFLDPDGDFVSGSSGKFKFVMQAAAGFGPGVKVVSLVSGDDTDSLQQQVDIADGLDPLVNGSNNSTDLIYDPSELTVTIARCAGQGATTTNGTGCFTVTFNKDIYADSFTQDVVVLTGGGVVSGFTQISSKVWKVDVTGITPGSTLTLTLTPAAVQDLSAVKNGVQVLGENTIRFALDEVATTTPQGSAAATNSANGTLAATGLSSNLSLLALALMLLGYSILLANKRVALMVKKS